MGQRRQIFGKKIVTFQENRSILTVFLMKILFLTRKTLLIVFDHDCRSFGVFQLEKIVKKYIYFEQVKNFSRRFVAVDPPSLPMVEVLFV